MVTHDQEEALTMADRIVVMNHGVIEQVGTPTEIYREPDHAVRRRLYRRDEPGCRRGGESAKRQNRRINSFTVPHAHGDGHGDRHIGLKTSFRMATVPAHRAHRI